VERTVRIAAQPKTKPYKGLAMEGPIATWYAKNTASAMPEFRALARRVADELSQGASILEIAPGPGYLAIELAKLSYRVTGLDISHTFVRIAAENAIRANVDVAFRHGDAAAQPFPADSFDFFLCRAAFKNFADPVGALREMHRVLRPGAAGLIIDMSRDASNGAIAAEVDKMNLRPVSAFATRTTLRSLKRRAYSREEFVQMLDATPFGGGEITESGIGFEIRLVKGGIR
jgi:ubiquinone/menaquinone biosynthesis C-methylase UbiE